MKKILKAILKKVKLRTIILLIVLLMFNSYAWFIYATKVSTSITARVTSWNVSFAAGQDETTTNVSFTVGRIYPGMETYSQSIIANNRGEMVAVLSYKINSITILGTTYEVDQNTTSEDLLDMIENDFPFHINITINNGNLQAGTRTRNNSNFFRMGF